MWWAIVLWWSCSHSCCLSAWSRAQKKPIVAPLCCSGFWLGHLLNCFTCLVLLTQRQNFPFAFSVVQEESLNVWTVFFDISHFQMLSGWLENEIKPHNTFTECFLLNTFAPQQQLCFQQAIYPKPSFDTCKVSLPLANPQGISWAITCFFYLEPRTHRKIYSWANIWKLQQLCLNIYVHANMVKDSI